MKKDKENITPGAIQSSPRTAEEPGPKGTNSESQNEEDDHDHEDEVQPKWKTYFPIAVSLALVLSGVLLDYLKIEFFTGYIRFLWYAVAYLLVGGKVLMRAFQNIRKGDVFNEFFLMSLATLGAFYLGEYSEGVAVMLFYVIGEIFQEAAVLRSRKSIKDLIDNRPQKVTLVKDGQFIESDPKAVNIGDTIQVKPGEKIALDGELLSESSSFNTAALTGESRPDTKRKGETILAGMINMDKVIELKVTSAYEDSALSKILKMVERATGNKAKTQQFISRFAKIYTPIVVALAALIIIVPYFYFSFSLSGRSGEEVYVFNDWLYRALIFLVISCPCALVISIPLGYFGGIGAASRNGILFKGSNYLDLMTRIDTVVMDKTGTLTKGVFKVQEIKAKDIEQEMLLSWTAALESKSTHPIATAITEHANGKYEAIQVSEVEEISGHGLKGKIEGTEILAGNTRLISKFNIPYNKEIEQIAFTIVVVAIGGKYAGYITIADEIKEDAVEAVKALHNVGIKEIVMLSGDKQAVVEEVAHKLSIDKYYGGLLPEDKVSRVEELKQQGKQIAFVGDGINDAPVITLADVGMAMGAMGSDAAIETADVVIQNDQPYKIVTAINIGKATNQVVWQNIGLSFLVKAVVLVLGAGGLATMWEAVFADVGVALLAILNAVRIQRMKF